MRVLEEHPSDGGANDQCTKNVIRGNSHVNISPRTLKLLEWHDREEANEKAPNEGAFH